MTSVRSIRRGIPETNWSAVHVERLAQEDQPQHFGCYLCGLAGVIDPLSTVYMVAGSSVCMQHLHEAAK